MFEAERASVPGDAPTERRRSPSHGALSQPSAQARCNAHERSARGRCSALHHRSARQHGTQLRRSAAWALVWCFIAAACGAPEPTMIGTPIDQDALAPSPSAMGASASPAPAVGDPAARDGQFGPAPGEHVQGEASWTLDRQQSYLSLISIKQTDIAEVHTFETFSASVGADGAASLVIDLASIATNVELRDERLREFLFETAAFPTASASLQLDLQAIDAIPLGDSEELSVTASFSLHGAEEILETTLLVVRISEDTLAVKTKLPIVLDARDYGLEPGIERLLQLAGLQSISRAVPVEFMLTFQRNRGASAATVGG